MSDLQIWLLVIGAAVVAAVLLFNLMQERRFRRQADAAFQTPMNVALMESDAAPREIHNRIEPALRTPVFDAGGDPADQDVAELYAQPLHTEPGTSRMDARVEHADAVAVPPPVRPVSTRVVPAVEPRAASPSVAAPPAPYDDLIEYRVRIGSEGVLANVFADAFTRSRTLGKAVRWVALPAGATEWEEIQPWHDVHYQQVAVTMQLADRNGAVQEEQLTALCDLLQTVARVHGLRVVCDDVAHALERAQSIDRFCVDVDVLIGLNVVARGEGAVNLARIVRDAESSGMVLGIDGVFQLFDSRGEPLYALCNHDAEPFSATVVEGQTSQGVTLQFDVPRVPDGLKVFDGMVAFGRKLANEIGGILVDDNLRPLTDTGIEKIRTQLTQIYESMEARGVPSGSRRALRLFS
jgi:FtsZ-interacting cell division protein ZipA